MGRSTLFSVGHKTFEVQEISDTLVRVCRRRNYVSRITVDKLNLLGICKCMELASEDKGEFAETEVSKPVILVSYFPEFQYEGKVH